MRTFTKILFIATVLILLSVNSYGQGFLSPMQEYFNPYDLTSMSLGQSSAAISGKNAFHENPAVPLPEGEVSISGLPFYNRSIYPPLSLPGFTENQILSLSAGYSYNRFSVSVNFSRSEYSVETFPDNTNNFVNNELVRIHGSYQISNNLYVGAGYIHASHTFPDYYSEDFSSDLTITASGISGGLYYEDSVSGNQIVFQQEAGLAVNNLSSGFNSNEQELDNSFRAMPSVVRLSGGLRAGSVSMKDGLRKYGAGLFAGMTKYLPRSDYNSGTGDFSREIGFRSLFNNWGSFEHYIGSEIETINMFDQISLSIGAEAHLRETFFIRAGTIGTADLYIRPQSSIGVEIDLYYFSLGAVRLIPHSSNRSPDAEGITRVQISLRIPVDGKPRPSLLRRLF